ncbi:unnamed protein product, partial [Oikopleura dioica]
SSASTSSFARTASL